LKLSFFRTTTSSVFSQPPKLSVFFFSSILRNCGEPLTALDGRDQGRGVERASCPTCALQLVRRDGGRWEGIRG